MIIAVLRLIYKYIIGIAAMLSDPLSRPFHGAAKMLLHDIRLLLERTAALDEYTLFTVSAAIAFTSVFTLYSLSNHIIISLDIIYLATTLMLIMYSIFKEPSKLLSETA